MKEEIVHNSKFKVEFTLKQHTPIIHFQSEQSGATLRASELKPKLDRFLKKYAFEGNIPSEYKISEEKDALDYKINVNTTSNSKQELIYKTYISKKDKDNSNLKVGSYFGDRTSIFYNDEIEILFISFNSSLLGLIKRYFIDFINITNFGTRQNKGFGSFSVITMQKQKVENNIEQSILKYYPTTYKAIGNEPLQKIMSDYQLLKSGTSNPQYKKSLLFEHMCNKEKRWEKRMIKEYMKKDYPEVFSTLKFEKEPITCQNENNFTYEYIRGLLGIADQIEFLKNNPRDFKDKIQIQIKSADSSVARFKSPITFKVIDKFIYVLATNDIPIKGKKFNFSIKGKEGILNEAIEVPKNFDIFQFLNFALPQLKYSILKVAQ